MTRFLTLLHATAAMLLMTFQPAATAQGFGGGFGGGERSVNLTMIPAAKAVSPGDTIDVLMRFAMNEHWHTYWQYAGPDETGFPPTVEWSMPAGFVPGDITFAVPERLITDIPGVGPSINYGFSNVVEHVVTLTVPADAKAGEVIIAGTVKWLACKEGICLPGQATFSFTLKVGDVSGAIAPEVAAARKALPTAPKGWAIAATRENGRVTLTGTKMPGPKTLRFIPWSNGLLDEVAAQPYSATGSGWTLELPAATGDHLKGLLVAPDNWFGWETGSYAALVDLEIVAATPGAATPAVVPQPPVSGSENPSAASATGETMLPAPEKDTTLPIALLLAFGGGMILNLMPCVLPILSIKIFDFVKQAEHAKTKPIVHGLVFAAGVLVSFWLLAGILLALRAGGEALGWGFQMQSPIFVAALAAFFVLFALSMFGVFEIGTGLIGIAGGKQQSGLGGSFFGGCIATLVATPCTAPFMGSALGFALTQPPAASMAVFTALGLGMATPYVVLTGFPGMLRVVPKPGAWMETFKQFLGFCLLATVVWLIKVFGEQTGMGQMIMMLAALLVFAMSAWVLGHWAVPYLPKSTRVRGRIAALALMFIGGWGLIAAAKPMVETIEWQPWSIEAESKALKAGKPIFIDFTAEWCITCKVNERVAFTKVVAQRLADDGVVTLKADWTNRSRDIADALAKYGRSGVPVYVLYDRKGNYELLPSFPLTESMILEALDKNQ